MSARKQHELDLRLDVLAAAIDALARCEAATADPALDAAIDRTTRDLLEAYLSLQHYVANRPDLCPASWTQPPTIGD